MWEVYILKKATILVITCSTLLLGGCFNLENTKEETNNVTDQQNQEEQYVSVQDYDGEGYTLRGGQEEAVDIAKQQKGEIVKAVEKFFLDNYKTEVKVNNFIGAKDAVSVTVESKNEPFFYTFAIVPVDFNSKTVATDQIFTLEGEVEQGIKSGLYVMYNKEEFNNLDHYIQSLKKKYPIVGKNKEALQNTNIVHGYATPHYFISVAGDTFKKLFDEYIENPKMNIDDLQEFFTKNPVNPEYINISMDFFMKEKDVKPDQEIFDTITHDIKKMQDLPKGSYSIYLNDNKIDQMRGSGRKDTTLSKKTPDQIIKN